MSIEYFQSNSSSSFPRCTEAKYAGNDDRLQIIDVKINIYLFWKIKDDSKFYSDIWLQERDIVQTFRESLSLV